ncbi:MAG: F0F1 ATP synthase subunit B [Actinomycetia bacterium]|nr:F0F1 ATP synthase subunit B [Actinomycetes bacterium]MCP5031875.1 F0F1 ATP synthase subunit B [Actinomycetes bacterium]
MKRTHVVAALLVSAAWVLVVSSPASASEESVGSCLVETMEEIGGAEGLEGFEKIIHDGHEEGASTDAADALTDAETELEGCLEAPSPILPELNEIIWGSLSFLVLLFAMVKWGFPAVRSAMEGRTEKIRSDIEAAEAERAEAANVRAQVDAELADSKANANRVIDEARQEAATVRADLQARAEADIAEMRRRADADVVAARQRALSDLQGEVNDIVVGAAERVVEANLDPAAQRQLVENYIASVGSQ